MHVRTIGYICVPTLSTYGEVDPFCVRKCTMPYTTGYIYTALYRSHQVWNSSRQEKCIIGNCNGRKNPEITETHCVTKDYVLRSTYRNIFIILLHSVHYNLYIVLFMLIISVYLRIKTNDTASSAFTEAWLHYIINNCRDEYHPWNDDSIQIMWTFRYFHWLIRLYFRPCSLHDKASQQKS